MRNKKRVPIGTLLFDFLHSSYFFPYITLNLTFSWLDFTLMM
jgi:hypothetical protein